MICTYQSATSRLEAIQERNTCMRYEVGIISPFSVVFKIILGINELSDFVLHEKLAIYGKSSSIIELYQAVELMEEFQACQITRF